MGKPIALIVAANRLLESLRPALSDNGLDMVEAACTDACDRVCSRRPAVAFVASGADRPHDGLDVVRRMREFDAQLPIILLAETSSEDLAIAAIKAGVTDYFKVPFDAVDLAASVHALVHAASPRSSPPADPAPAIVGSSRMMRDLRQYIEKIAGIDTSVLITGETGTGKDLVAQALHRHGPRRQKPFVSINCAAIPDSLLESELFGCERGAFTGADTARPGHLSAAAGGTVLLDEIGEMTPYAQVKILRALDTREIYRLGSTRKITLDVRVIAATNQDLERLIAAGKFRRDLYYRLNVSRIRLPPLRERPEDIPALLEHYVADMNRRFHRTVQGFTAEARQMLVEYDWPGNVREMKNVLEGVFAELPNRSVTFLDTPPFILKGLVRQTTAPHDERDRLIHALSATEWNVSQVARRLHWSRMTVYRKLAKYHLTRD
jgi:DNA-binding NtrC family response regulator